jgi:hypothetical protein
MGTKPARPLCCCGTEKGRVGIDGMDGEKAGGEKGLGMLR